jgi:phenylalanyl-tRNA synthetase alpha chain
MSFKDELERLRASGVAEIAGACDSAALESARVKYFGRQGLLPELMKKLGDQPASEKPQLGKLANEVKKSLEAEFENRRIALADAADAPSYDWSLPGRPAASGHLHPITQTTRRIVDIFRKIGFEIADGPEVETEFFCFDALNTPADHPARDLQDTLYLATPDAKGDRRLLRTHTSSVQIRTLVKQAPPIRIVAPGRVYRRDEVDATHAACFHQVEGLCVDRNVSVADLKGVVEYFFKELLGRGTRTRLRPHFFPYTEPSFEIDFSAESAGIHKKEWLEIAGCGMVHPNVLRAVGHDPEEWSGWAFGLGVERIAMVLHGINDIRLLYENDQRFLHQF